MFRWLHFSLADQRAQRRIGELEELPAAARELLLARDEHQRALIADGVVACVIHDFMRDFDRARVSQLGGLRFALAPQLMVTARLHPVCCADIVKRAIDGGAVVSGPAAALDLLVSAVVEITAGVAGELTHDIQTLEDALLDQRRDPDARALVGQRREAVQLHRQIGGLRLVFHRLEEDADLPDALGRTAARIAQRLAALDGDIAALQGQTRMLREELDLRAAQRINRNLYVLSVMTALMLPATLVTGIFGMNTGGLPLAGSQHGTLIACLLVLISAFGVYLWLRRLGLFRGAEW